MTAEKSVVHEIEPPHEAFYIHGMLFCTTILCEDIRNFESLPIESTPPAEVLNRLQGIVVHLGGLSRYLWPSNVKRHGWRGEALRKAFSVAADSPLRCRMVRNTIEHLDEHLDRQLARGFAGNFIPAYVGQKPSSDSAKTIYYRAYFTDTGEFSILGNGFVLGSITSEIRRLHHSLLECIAHGHRLPSAANSERRDRETFQKSDIG